jgi:hypothetical protein
VNSILRHVAAIQGFKSSEELEDLYRKTAWRFEAKTKKKGSSYDVFKQVTFIHTSNLDLTENFRGNVKLSLHNHDKKKRKKYLK